MHTFTMGTQDMASYQAGRLEFDWQADHQGMQLNFYSQESFWMTGMLYDAQHNLRGQLLVLLGEKKFFLGPDLVSTSQGWVAGPLPQGSWYMDYYFHAQGPVRISIDVWQPESIVSEKHDRINIYHVQEGYQAYLDHLTDSKKSSEGQWFAGDLHSHTLASDGRLSVKEQICQAHSQALDFAIISDHNVALTYLPSTRDVVIYPGIELTTDFGDVNILWLTANPFQDQSILKLTHKETLARFIHKMKDIGIVSINHPFLGEFAWYAPNISLTDIDSIEIINAPIYAENVTATSQALQLWDALLNDGHKIWGVGGSDTHDIPEDISEPEGLPSRIGDPTTWIFSESLAPQAMKAAYKQGHIKVGRYCQFDVDFGSYLPGDTIQDTQSLSEIGVAISVDSVMKKSAPLQIQCIIDGQVYLSTIGETAEFTVPDFFYDGNYHWLRIQVWQGDGLIAFANPIFIGEKSHQLETWGQAMQASGVTWIVPHNQKPGD